MADTLLTTCESATSGTAAALYVDAQGAFGVPGITARIDGLPNSGIPATHQDPNSADTPCEHIIDTALGGLGRAAPRAEPSAKIALDRMAALCSLLDRPWNRDEAANREA